METWGDHVAEWCEADRKRTPEEELDEVRL
jgi:hypothetical protein